MSAVDSESARPKAGTLDSKHVAPSGPASLTRDKLEDLGAQLKRQDSSNSKQSENWMANTASKKRAIGQGASPSSSVRTTYSNTSRPLLDTVASPKAQACSLSNTRDTEEMDIARPPATGKRLYEPDSDSPYHTAQTSNTRERPKSSPGHRRVQKSTGSHS
jgi:hypothetical protein